MFKFELATFGLTHWKETLPSGRSASVESPGAVKVCAKVLSENTDMRCCAYLWNNNCKKQ